MKPKFCVHEGNAQYRCEVSWGVRNNSLHFSPFGDSEANKMAADEASSTNQMPSSGYT